MIAPLFILARRFVTLACLGRNGMEYSVLLLVCLIGVAWAHLPRKTT